MRTETWARHRPPSVALRIVGVVLAGAIAVVGAQALFPHASEWLSVGTSLVGGLGCGFAAVRTAGAMRLAWVLLAMLVVFYAAGDALWIIYADATGSPLILSLADAMYLVALPPATLGLIAYPVLRGVTGRWRPILLDAAVLVLAVSSISHTLALSEVFATVSTRTEGLMLAVYPLTDGMLMSLAFVLLLRSVGQPRLDVVLIGCTFAIYTAADNGYAVMTVRDIDSIGTWVDTAYVVAPLLLGGAALVAALTPTPRRVATRNLSGLAAPLLPDLTALLALGLSFTLAPDDTPSRAIALVLLVAVGIRQLAQTASAQNLRVRLEQRLAQRGRELTGLAARHRQLEVAKFEFITSVSHELRTPLAAIRGSLELLHDGDLGQLPPQARPIVDVATRGSERLSRLVDDIIDLERLENGAFGMSPVSTDLRALVTDTVASLAPLADDRGVRLLATPGRASARCDADRILQVLVNLVGNALKYAPEGSDITVGIEQRGALAVVSVADAGHGIPPDELEAVFGRFHQVNPTDDQRRGGTGLGLAICKGIVERHGGTIWVESAGAGATFRFTLPLAVVTDAVEPAVPAPV